MARKDNTNKIIIDRELIELGNRLLEQYAPFCTKKIDALPPDKYEELLIRRIAERWRFDIKRDMPAGYKLYRTFRIGGASNVVNEVLSIFYFGHKNNWNQDKMNEEYCPLIGVQNIDERRWWQEFKEELEEERISNKSRQEQPVFAPTKEQKEEILKKLLTEREKMKLEDGIKEQIKLLEQSKKFAEADDVIARLQIEDEADLAGKYHQRAGLNAVQNNLEAALSFYGKAVGLQPANGQYLSDYATFLIEMGNYNDGKELLLKALDIFINKHGEVNEDVAAIYNDLGYIELQLCNYKNVDKYCQKALKIEESLLGEDNVRSARVLNNLACMEHYLGHNDKAIKMFERTLKIDLKALGEFHVDVSIRYNNIGILCLENKKPKDALNYIEKCIYILKKIYGELHPLIASGNINMGTAFKDLKEFDKSLYYLDLATKQYNTLYKKDHPQKAVCAFNTGWTYQMNGDFKRALEYFDKAFIINKQFYSLKHQLIGRDYFYKASAYAGLQEWKKAVEFCQAGLEVYCLYYSKKDLKLIKVKNSLDTFKRKLQKQISQKTISKLNKI